MRESWRRRTTGCCVRRALDDSLMDERDAGSENRQRDAYRMWQSMAAGLWTVSAGLRFDVWVGALCSDRIWGERVPTVGARTAVMRWVKKYRGHK